MLQIMGVVKLKSGKWRDGSERRDRKRGRQGKYGRRGGLREMATKENMWELLHICLN